MLAKLLSGDWGFYIWVIENGHPKTEANGALGFGTLHPFAKEGGGWEQ